MTLPMALDPEEPSLSLTCTDFLFPQIPLNPTTPWTMPTPVLGRHPRAAPAPSPLVPTDPGGWRPPAGERDPTTPSLASHHAQLWGWPVPSPEEAPASSNPGHPNDTGTPSCCVDNQVQNHGFHPEVKATVGGAALGLLCGFTNMEAVYPFQRTGTWYR